MSTLLLLLLQCLYWINTNSNNISIPVACTPPNDKFVFCNVSLPLIERINNIISLLTLNEKAQLLTARESPSIQRLGIPEYDWGTNCIHSVVSPCDSKHCPTTFAETNGLGATFNKSLIYNISVVIGLELRALWLQNVSYGYHGKQIHVGLDCWGPTINIGRDPRWGRNYEVPSEDPYWNGIYGTMFTLGLQNGSIDTGYHDPNYYLVASTLKHLAAYSLGGYQSFTFDAIVSDYMFADTYFPPFIASIKNGNAKGIMCSYNAINCVPACVDNGLLNETLRQNWKFDGYITSDSGAIKEAYKGHHYTNSEIEATALALKSGCDINSGYMYSKYIPTLVRDGTISEDLVNKAVYNSFKVRFELGLFDQPITNQIYFNIPPSIINNKKHQELNLFATHQIMTLLKNDNILPFDPNNKDLIYAVIGPHYNASTQLNGGYTGSMCINGDGTSCILSILSGIALYVDSDNILYSEGCNGVLCNSTAGFLNASKVANESDIIILMMGLNDEIEKEGIDRVNISLPGYQQELASIICKMGKPTVLVLINGGIISIDELKFECPSILEMWYPGFRGSQGFADTIFGLNNPGGKLPVTMYWSNFTKTTSWNGPTSMDLTSKPFGRTYKYWSGTNPLYPFGWGLSYTIFKFEFYNDSKTTDCDQINKFCVKITNIGHMNGHETIFVFIAMSGNKTIAECEPAWKMIKRLVEFDKIYLEIGDSYIFKWNFNKTHDLKMYSKNGSNVLFAGNYTIYFTNGVDENLNVNVEINKYDGDIKDILYNDNCDDGEDITNNNDICTTNNSDIIILVICCILGLIILIIIIALSLWCYAKRKRLKQSQQQYIKTLATN